MSVRYSNTELPRSEGYILSTLSTEPQNRIEKRYNIIFGGQIIRIGPIVAQYMSTVCLLINSWYYLYYVYSNPVYSFLPAVSYTENINYC